jgi:hypothetical protein
MTSRDASNRKIDAQLKKIRAEFSDYENAVTLISSVEAWIEHEWGGNGKSGKHLVKFDRFPVLGDNLTPDFIAEFDTPYVLCGEHKKNYHPNSDDREQIIAYSNWQPPNVPRPGYDVLLLVSTHNDDAAAKDIYGDGKEPKPQANVVIVGYFREAERVNGEWFSLKWRDHGGKNRKFSKPNATGKREEKGLNSLLSNKPTCSIQVSKPAIDLSGRNPIINDEPPPLYTAVRIIQPAINELLTDADRDTLASARRVEKTLSRTDILSTDILRRLSIREKTVQLALDFLVKVGLAKKLPEADPPKYSLTVDLKFLKSDSMELMSKKAAFALVPKIKGLRGRPAKRRASKGQMNLFDSGPS